MMRLCYNLTVIQLIVGGQKMQHAKPFLKWAGGKRRLLERFSLEYPEALTENKLDTYIEPFAGGGSVFIDLIQRYQISNVIVNDINDSLITTYTVVQKVVDSLIEKLKIIEDKYLDLDAEGRKEYFYLNRERFNELKNLNGYQLQTKDSDTIADESIELASLFIFLNKTCFNGLYRENQKGGFNVPHGRYKNPQIAEVDNLKACHKAFKQVEFVSEDYHTLIQHATGATFVYLDPPYRPLDASKKTFNGYSKGSFDDEEQKRLASWCKELDSQSIYFMLSNSNPKIENPEDDFFEVLYRGFNYRDDIVASRTISAKGSTRKPVTEILVKNY